MSYISPSIFSQPRARTCTTLLSAAALAALLAACAKPTPAPKPTAAVAVPAAVLLAPQPVVPAVVATPAADHVHTGRIACELGQFITVEETPGQSGQYTISGKGFKYQMQRVATTTGAVRLEDQKAGAVWLQIANKSMLMNQKQGRRMADECRSPEQQIVAEKLRKDPQVGNLFDAPKR